MSTPAVNQCDGCMAGWPTRICQTGALSGRLLHDSPDGNPWSGMVCQRGRYLVTDTKHALRQPTGCTCGWRPKDEHEAGDVEDQFARHVATMKAWPS